MKAMALREQDLEMMAKHMQKVFPILRELSPSEQVNTSTHEVYLLELRHQRELLDKLIHQMDKRFDQVDKRFEREREETNRQFEREREERNKQFEQVDKRFEQVDKQFEVAREERYRQSKRNQWMIGIGFTMMTIIMSMTIVMK